MLVEHPGKRPRIDEVPIGWIAVGDPAEILPPNEHDPVWSIQEPLNFPREIIGLEGAASGQTITPELTRRYAKAVGRHRGHKTNGGWTQ